MGRWERSLELIRQSVAVLRMSPGLTRFPLIAGLVGLVASIVFCVPAGLLFLAHPSEHPSFWVWVILAVYYFVSTFVATFFAVAIAGCVYQTLNGRPTSFADGMKYAAARLPAILGWAAIDSTVGTAFKIFRDRSGIFAQVASFFAELGWRYTTYFVVPIIAIEGAGTFKSIERSSALLKRTWGEQLIGNVSVNFVFRILSLVVLVPIVLAFLTLSLKVIVPVVVGSFLYLFFLAVVASSVAAVYEVALYIYASTGVVPAGFSAMFVASAFSSQSSTSNLFELV